MSGHLYDYIAAVDIGTTKISVLVAHIKTDGEVTIVGIGTHPSHGLQKGSVVNIQATVASIKQAAAQAEAMAGVKIESAVVGIAGNHIKSFNSTGVVGIKNRDVTQDDIDRVIEAAKAIPIEQDREILHVLPQHFRVDGQDMVQDSLGMYGVRLEAQVHIVTGAISSAQNIIKSCELAGIRVRDIVLEQLASARAVLTPTEQQLGVGILDIGGGTSDFAVYKNDRIRYTKVLPIAGSNFTHDIAIGLGIPVLEAEELKRTYGCVTAAAHAALGVKKVTIPLDYEGGQKAIDTSALLGILRPRAEEIFSFLHEEIITNRLISYMPSGLVITGGGALLKGLDKQVEQQYNMPVRIGLPRYYFSQKSNQVMPATLLSPSYATGYGLLAFALRQKNGSLHHLHAQPLLTQVFERMKSWIYDFL